MLRKIIDDATQFSRGQKGGDKADQTRSEEAVESASRYSCMIDLRNAEVHEFRIICESNSHNLHTVSIDNHIVSYSTAGPTALHCIFGHIIAAFIGSNFANV